MENFLEFWHLFFMLTWIFVFFLPSVCSGMNTPKMYLESAVFVAFTGEDLTISCKLNKPANQTSDILACFDPFHKQIYSCDITATDGSPKTDLLQLELKNLSISGEYLCRYKTANVYWFLRVRAEGYKDPQMFDYTEFIILAVFTGVLLVFSVVGSVYVFTEHWKEKVSKCNDSGRKQKQNQDKSKEKEREADKVDAMAAQSTSFYASLEPRPRSIYDVLDHSAANKQLDQKKTKAKKKDVQRTAQQKPGHQDEGVFESVYENF